MELTCSTLQPRCSRAVAAPHSRTLLPPLLSFRTNPARFRPLKGSHLGLNPVRLGGFSVCAVSGVSNDCSEEKVRMVDDDDAGQKSGEGDGGEGSLEEVKMIRVCDKLVEVFLVDKPTPTEWRRLLAFSKEWDNIRPHFFRRCQERADNEDDAGMKHKLLRLARKLKEVDDDVQRHNELLKVIKTAPSEEIGIIVSRRRKDFTKEFFEHLHTVVASYDENPEEQNALAKLGNMCLAAVEAYDSTSESIEALNAAELKFQDIINSPTIDAACKKIDSLAEKNQLDSALVLMISKAWSAAKESDLMKDEAKDMLYHLYVTARGNLQRLMPKEIRIVKYLLTIEDPQEVLCALKDAFIPGEEIEGEHVDSLYTTPEKLHAMVTAVINAYHNSRVGTLIREARDLMNPKIIEKLKQIKQQLEKDFM